MTVRKYINLDMKTHSIPSALGAFLFGGALFFVVFSVLLNSLALMASFVTWEWIGLVESLLVYRLLALLSLISAFRFARDTYNGDF